MRPAVSGGTPRLGAGSPASDGALPPPGLYAILDGGRVPAERVGVAAASLAQGGASLVQLRLKGQGDRARLAAQRAAAAALAGRGVWLVVNDRPDLARILRDEAPPGVFPALHLGQDDLPPRAARRIVGPGVLVGLSTHSLADVRAAQEEPVDYLGFGPIFATPSKRGAAPPVGLSGLRDAARASRLPLVAIGGLSLDTAGAVRAAGARWAAFIGALFDGIRWDEEPAGASGEGAAEAQAAALVGARAAALAHASRGPSRQEATR